MTYRTAALALAEAAGIPICREVRSALADDSLLEARLTTLAAELGPGPVQPTHCGRCGEQIHDAGGCRSCGNVGNVTTVRSPDHLNR